MKNSKNRIRIDFDAIGENEALARSVAASFIAPLDPTLEELADVRTAVSEAVTNAIIHGYRRTSGSVVMELQLDGRLLTVRVTDFGCGIENVELAMQPFYTSGDGGERSGMGFAVMQAFMDTLEVDSQVGKGTSVVMKKALSAPDDAD